jgi:hypothetical protein
MVQHVLQHGYGVLHHLTHIVRPGSYCHIVVIRMHQAFGACLQAAGMLLLRPAPVVHAIVGPLAQCSSIGGHLHHSSHANTRKLTLSRHYKAFMHSQWTS